MKEFEQQHEKLRAELEALKAYKSKQTSLAFIDCGPACAPACTCNCSSDVSYLQNRIDSIARDYYSLWEKLYDHMNKGHIPEIVGADKMGKALKALGLDGDFEVKKNVIYASDGSISQRQFILSEKSA